MEEEKNKKKTQNKKKANSSNNKNNTKKKQTNTMTNTNKKTVNNNKKNNNSKNKTNNTSNTIKKKQNATKNSKNNYKKKAVVNKPKQTNIKEEKINTLISELEENKANEEIKETKQEKIDIKEKEDLNSLIEKTEELDILEKEYEKEKIDEEKIEEPTTKIIIDKDIDSEELIKKIDNQKDQLEKKQEKNKTDIIFIVITILILLISLMIFLTIPYIKLKGDKELNIVYNTEYKEPGYKATKTFHNITKKIKITNNINSKKVGQYKVTYSYPYLWFKIKKTRIINIVDDVKPEIKLKGNIDTLVCPNTEYKEEGYEAIDEYDGDLTKKVKVKVNKNYIEYKVTDSSNNKYKIKRNLTYKDEEKPKIELKGNDNITLYVGDTYEEPGYTATDNCDGDLSSKIEVSGNVDTSNKGTYTLTYKVSDNSKNEATITRTIEIKQRTIIRHYGGGSGKGVIYLTFDDGPNEGTTNTILNILSEEGVPATFFVTCNGPDYLIQRMANEGHTVALHTATHSYSYVYASVSNYFADLNRVSNRVENLTGIKSMIIRFPGGSSNTVSRNYSSGIMTTLTSEVVNRGYHYFDWNVDSGDAAGASTNGVYSNVVNNISLDRENVVLMHDVKYTTANALRDIIRYGKNNGFTFSKITYDTAMVTHGVNN